MNHRRTTVLLFLISILALLASGCATTSSKGGPPSWMDSPYDKQYDEDTYLCSVGTGSSREKAVDAALASLSQIFNSQVRSSTTVTSLSTASEDASGNVTFTEQSEMFDQGTVSSVTEKIIGAEVVNTYMDANARLYVRVALHRKRTADLYQKELGELSTSLMEVRTKALSAVNPLSRYFLLSKAVSIAKMQQSLIDQMQVLLQKSLSSQLPALQRELVSVASNITVGLDVRSSEATEPLEAAFSQKLQQLGFQVVPLAANPPATLEITYTVTPIVMNDSPYRYARYDLAAQLKNAEAIVFSFQKSEREAALSESDAVGKALKQATGNAVDEFFTLLAKKLGE